VIVDPAGESPAKPYGKALGDISGDGQPDLFISSAAGDGMYWYRYPDWEKFAIRTGGSWSEDCQVIDIDRDGDRDVINGSKRGLFWYENPLSGGGRPATGQWREHRIGSDGTNIHDLEIADLNGDDKPDIVVRYEKEYQKPVCLFMQVHPDEWTADTNTNTSHRKGEGLALGDLDGDTDMDIALGDIWLENGGEGKVRAEHVYTEGMPDQMILKLADVDRDGGTDIIAAPQSSQSGKLAWYSAGPDPFRRWTEHVIRDPVSHMHGLGTGDFNRDGYPDIHTSLRHDHPGEQDHVSIWISGGGPEPLFREQVLATSGSHFSKTGDVDQDGDTDVFGANWSGPDSPSPDILLWRNQSPPR
jgi:hypothetical protein